MPFEICYADPLRTVREASASLRDSGDAALDGANQLLKRVLGVSIKKKPMTVNFLK